MLQCDWCHKPIYDEHANGWAYQLEYEPFHSLSLGRSPSGGPKGLSPGVHLHVRPCRGELSWAISRLLEMHDPLLTDRAEETEVEEAEGSRDESDNEWAVRRARRKAWERVPAAERERHTLNVLGNDRLTVRELTERMNAALPEYELYESSVRSLVTRLVRVRELDRKGEHWRKGNSIRYRYFRRGLEGPITDLERAFYEQDTSARDGEEG